MSWVTKNVIAEVEGALQKIGERKKLYMLIVTFYDLL